MSHDTRIASKTQTQPSDNIHRHPRYKHTTASVLAIVAGIILALASATINALYGWSRSDIQASQATWAAVSVAASIILALAPSALLKAIRAGSLAGGLTALLAIALCGSYSFTCAIGASAGQRLSAQATQTDTEGTRVRLQTAYKTAQDALQALPAFTATVAELDAKITALRQTPGANNCEKIDGPISKRVCPEAAALEVERARATRREALQTTMAEASSDLATLGPAKPANTDAAAISGYLAVAGVQLSTDALNRWLALLAVALVEFGGGLAFALSSVLREPFPTALAERTEANVSTPTKLQAVDTAPDVKEMDARTAPLPVSNGTPPKLVVPDSFSGRLLELVRGQGGELYSGHRALGRALGCSAGHVGNLLRDLTNAGAVTVQATKMGTVVRLAA